MVTGKIRITLKLLDNPRERKKKVGENGVGVGVRGDGGQKTGETNRKQILRRKI